jgi:3-oxosteroid 1-dehydrogenase
MTDVIVVGAGLAGLSAAIAARHCGHAVTVFEKSDMAGGAAAFSGGQVWVGANHVQARLGIEDSIARVETYVRAIAAEDPGLLDEPTMQRWIRTAPVAAEFYERLGAVTWEILPGFPDYFTDQPGAAQNGRYLTAEFDGTRLGVWRSRLRIARSFPVGTSYAELFEQGRNGTAFAAAGISDRSDDRLTFGPGVVAGFLATALACGVDIWLEHEVTALLVEEPGVVAGVRLRDGEELRGAVVLATSGFDWDADLARRYYGVEDEDRGSVAPCSLTGDGMRLATAAGADVIEFPNHRVPIIPGREDPGEPGFVSVRHHSLPHAFVVDRTGRRFADDAVYWEITDAALGRGHLPCWLIWDTQHRRRYGDGHPSELVIEAATLSELGARLGVDGAELERTAARFSEHADRGEDPEFGRGSNETRRMFGGDPQHNPNANLGSVREPPFYGMRLRMVSTGIGLTGIRVDADGRVLDQRGAPIRGLYAAGSCAAFTSSGTGYNSGFSLSRAMTFGYVVADVVGRDVDGPPRAAAVAGS